MATRLIVELPNGVKLAGRIIDLTGVPNADAQFPLRIVIQQQCDMGSWHRYDYVDLPCYDGEKYDPSVMTDGPAA